MTRQEAIEIWRDKDKLRSAGEIIDSFVALGMLKLDEPKSVEERFCHALYGSDNGGMAAITEALEISSLRIVEK